MSSDLVCTTFLVFMLGESRPIVNKTSNIRSCHSIQNSAWARLSEYQVLNVVILLKFGNLHVGNVY